MQIPIFKIRCSAIGEIMGGTSKPTQKQLAELDRLENKDRLTNKQAETLAELIAKRDAKPNLQEGAKTYCQNWLKEQIYNKRKEFSNKYTEKGILCEPAAIEMIAERIGYGFISKNEQHYENEYITGTPDVVIADIIEEAKSSWSIFTFPLFPAVIPDKDYPLQVTGYMALTGRRKAAVNYCLIDAPSELIDAEAWRQARKLGMSEMDAELYDEVCAKMTYTDVPIELKHRRFEFDYDENVVTAIYEHVKLCRIYIQSLIDGLPKSITLVSGDLINSQQILLAQKG